MGSENKPGWIQVLFSKFNIAGILILSTLLAVLFYTTEIQQQMTGESGMLFFAKTWLYNFIYTFVIWLGCVAIIFYLDQKLPWKSHVVSRLVLQTILILAFASLANIYLCRLINFLNASTIISSEKIWNNMVISWVATVIMNLLWAGIYFFREWKKSLLETEVLKQAQLRTQYEILKNQVNPHFLFNALNTLAALIPEDAKKAEQFVVNMSDVYRYILTAKEQDTVTVQEEFECLESFIFLNQMRFGENLRIHRTVRWEGEKGRLIPMSLQLLVENAIKHNEISRNHPLDIEIITEKDGIWVVNPKRKKMSVPGTGNGLKNLHLRYEGTGKGILPVVYDDEKEFRVFVPYIDQDLK